jgi:hypothetical protein
LVLKAEALYLVEVEGGLLGENLVHCYSRNRLVAAIIDLIKSESGLTRIYNKACSLRLKLPGQIILGVCHE